MRRFLLIGAAAAFIAPAAAWGLVFRPATLPAAKVGVPYKVVIRVSQDGHHPALGKNYPSYTVECYGADARGGFIDDCNKLPPGLKLKELTDPTCAPPLQKPACVVIAGKPTKPGRYTFRLSAPNLASGSVRGIIHRFTLIVRP